MDKPVYRLKISTVEEVRRYLSYYGLAPVELGMVLDRRKKVKHYFVLKSKKLGLACGLVAVLEDGQEYNIDLHAI